MTHVLTPKHTLLLTVAIGSSTLQTQQLVVAMEMRSVVCDSRHNDVTMTCVHQQIPDVTFQILRNHGHCVVSCVIDSRSTPNLDLNSIKAMGVESFLSEGSLPGLKRLLHRVTVNKKTFWTE